MCTENIHTVVYADGREETSRKVERCALQPRGFRCANPIIFHYPKTYHESDNTTAAAAATSRLPPTPRMTPQGSPRPSTPLAYNSASESDHSRRSGGSGGRRHHHRVYTSDSSGAAQYINVSHRHGGYSHRPHHQERIVIVDGPPTPRTPPQAFDVPFTAPSSPRSGYNMAAAHYNGRHERHGDLLRPVIVDERPIRHVHFDEDPDRLRRGHRRHRSSETRTENPFAPSSSAAAAAAASAAAAAQAADAEDRERARRRAERQRALERIIAEKEQAKVAEAMAKAAEKRAERKAEKKLDQNLAKAERIAQLNQKIDSRPAVPVALRRTATDFEDQERERELREAVGRMQIGDDEANPRPRGRGLRRRVTGMAAETSSTAATAGSGDVKQTREQWQAQIEEEEAMRRRLAERMMPRRRATVGPGSRRYRVVYENGMYRWE